MCIYKYIQYIHQTGSWENHRPTVPNGKGYVSSLEGVYIRLMIEFDRLIDRLVVSFHIPC